MRPAVPRSARSCFRCSSRRPSCTNHRYGARSIINAFSAEFSDLAGFTRIDRAFMERFAGLLDELWGTGENRANVDLDTATTLLYGRS